MKNSYSAVRHFHLFAYGAQSTAEHLHRPGRVEGPAVHSCDSAATKTMACPSFRMDHHGRIDLSTVPRSGRLRDEISHQCQHAIRILSVDRMERLRRPPLRRYESVCLQRSGQTSWPEIAGGPQPGGRMLRQKNSNGFDSTE